LRGADEGHAAQRGLVAGLVGVAVGIASVAITLSLQLPAGHTAALAAAGLLMQQAQAPHGVFWVMAPAAGLAGTSAVCARQAHRV
jgi:hypothetical protein